MQGRNYERVLRPGRREGISGGRIHLLQGRIWVSIEGIDGGIRGGPWEA